MDLAVLWFFLLWNLQSLRISQLVWVVYKKQNKKKTTKVFVDLARSRQSAPAGGVLSAHLQQVGFNLLRVLLEALGEGANQTCCAALILHQLHGVTWHTQTQWYRLDCLFMALITRVTCCCCCCCVPLTLELAWTNILRSSFLSRTVSRRRRKLCAPLLLTAE